MSDNAITNARPPQDPGRRHRQRIKLGVLIACAPWLLLGMVGLVSAGITGASAARVPLDRIMPLAIGTLAACALVSVAGVAVGVLGLMGWVACARGRR